MIYLFVSLLCYFYIENEYSSKLCIKMANTRHFKYVIPSATLTGKWQKDSLARKKDCQSIKR